VASPLTDIGFNERGTPAGPPNECEGEQRKARCQRPAKYVEVYSTGPDEFLQMQGGDPYGGLSGMGVRVPFLPTPPVAAPGPFAPLNPGSALDLRYLFNLCSFTLGNGARARIRGYRQYLTIGTTITASPFGTGSIPTYVERPVVTPNWRFTDASISWHIHVIEKRQVPQPSLGPQALANVGGIAFRMSDAPALLYETIASTSKFYVNLTGYTPPNRGRPWGRAINSQLGSFYDLRAPWLSGQAWDSLDIPVDGPCQVAFYASMRQTNPGSRPSIVASQPAGLSVFPGALTPEDQFVTAFSVAPEGFTYGGVVYWRVAGSLIVEMDA